MIPLPSSRTKTLTPEIFSFKVSADYSRFNGLLKKQVGYWDNFASEFTKQVSKTVSFISLFGIMLQIKEYITTQNKLTYFFDLVTNN